MSRNSSGTYTLPAGNPVVSATTISTTWANTTLGDISTELTSSLERNGKGGMLAPVRGVDGSAAAPAVSFTSEPGTGLYKSAAGEIAISLLGALTAKFTAGILSIAGTARAFLQSTAANSVVQILGNRNATDTGADVETNGQTTRTAGLLLQINNNAIPKLNVDYQGLARLDAAAVAAAIQPASLWTAITPNANWTAGSGLAYWKDACGMVHMKGTLIPSIGFGNPFTFPAGFRPAFGRTLSMFDSGTPTAVQLNTDGSISTTTFTAGHTYYMDAVSFLAEQ